jgi:hypothetical protein
MKLLPLDKLGARQSAPGTFDFGVMLPWVSAADGNRVRVKLIHERDQFLKARPAQSFELTHSLDPKYGDYWSGQAVLANPSPGTYVYRLEIENPLPASSTSSPIRSPANMGSASSRPSRSTTSRMPGMRTSWRGRRPSCAT